jgi:uncharacterized membrane protein YkvA (DUF1232 family)
VIRFLRLWRLGANDLRLLWFALRHPRRPRWLLPAVAVLAFYALEPLNFVVPMFGVVDDLVILPLLLHLLVQLLPLDIRTSAEIRASAKRRSLA